ncbi:hypothetical protein H6P81_020887 [Aristolochia fimbriata]|uniref:Ribosomal protein L25 beta domain-containing protein n=1 Tax=Aristolochia fimbriata TaxID=158543 RepID=A0AAV7DVN7_ARIFI|nr:hypothetical protein H6P81_020887 [Aristolochia fimbriata]
MLKKCCSQAVRLSSPGPLQEFISSFCTYSSLVSSSRRLKTIDATPREVSGQRASSKLRSQGQIPSVVLSRGEYSGDGLGHVSKKLLVSTDRKQIKSLLWIVKPELFCSTPFELQIRAGSGSSCILQSGRVLPVKLHVSPETREVLNLVFEWLDDKSEISVDVPVVIKGHETSPGLQKGGTLNKIINSLKFQCPVDEIPQKVEVDVRNLDVGDKITLQDLEFNPSLKLLSKIDSRPICKIVRK